MARRGQTRAPPGLNRAITGSAAVGHDTNAATDESIKNTTYTTVALVILILLVVYRSPILAMVPLVTIALSVFASLRLIALLTKVPGLGFQVIDITQIFVVVVLFGAGPITVSSWWRGTGRSWGADDRWSMRSAKRSGRWARHWSPVPRR